MKYNISLLNLQLSSGKKEFVHDEKNLVSKNIIPFNSTGKTVV